MRLRFFQWDNSIGLWTVESNHRLDSDELDGDTDTEDGQGDRRRTPRRSARLAAKLAARRQQEIQQEQEQEQLQQIMDTDQVDETPPT